MGIDRIAILWDKASDRGTFSSGSWETDLPLNNLLDSDVRKAARTTDATTASTKFRIDLTSSRPEVVNCFAMLNHNGSTAATWRIVVTDDASDANPSLRLLDTGFISMWVPTVLLGTLPWGTFPWDGFDDRAYPSGISAFHISESSPVARYIWVYISDAANADGYFEAGRFISGSIWSPAINYNFGASIRYVDNSEIKRTRGGKRLTVNRPVFRNIEVAFDNLTESEAYGVGFEVSRQLGKTGDFLIILNPSDTGDLLFKKTIYASLTDTAPIVTNQFDRWQWAISAEELI